MKELLVATGNRGKLKEITALLDGMVDLILSPADFPDLPQIEEDGINFEENALKKAQCAAKMTGRPAIADDSGLVVDALGGRPGVHSARYAGIEATDALNNAKLLREMAGVPLHERTAAFHCTIALCYPDETCYTFTGSLDGVILEQLRGEGGFGYDPLFMVPDYGLTLAELPLAEKNSFSHRGKALALLKQHLLAG